MFGFGKSKMKDDRNDFVIDGDTLLEYHGGCGDVVIPNGIRVIAAGAFQYESASSVKIPNSVVEIGRCAFDDVLRLSEITIPGGVTIVQEYSFARCQSLTRVRLSYGVKKIEPYAFYDCRNLTEVILPEGLEEICASAFCCCDSLTKVYLPHSCHYYKNASFPSWCQVVWR